MREPVSSNLDDEFNKVIDEMLSGVEATDNRLSIKLSERLDILQKQSKAPKAEAVANMGKQAVQKICKALELLSVS